MILLNRVKNFDGSITDTVGVLAQKEEEGIGVMTTPTGTISMSQVRTEIGDTGSISFNDANVRTLAGKSSGAISMYDMRGKSWEKIVSKSLTYSWTSGGQKTWKYSGTAYYAKAKKVVLKTANFTVGGTTNEGYTDSGSKFQYRVQLSNGSYATAWNYSGSIGNSASTFNNSPNQTILTHSTGIATTLRIAFYTGRWYEEDQQPDGTYSSESYHKLNASTATFEVTYIP